ncbi:MAG: hypothetical protein IV112_18650 [Methyloversatilis discipulorum]|uniref:hypothetical protein n=1 Tax=Methyloversatilis discipulorum TaxID=1119528 RepID=UPI0026EB9750|nr:hypothetical protein [Methyloversatilis discipulorum]MBT9518709.1 hypothetical protein [Methyloversatilis discipulorum]
MNMDALWTAYARAGYVFLVLIWLVVGGIAALWWVPALLAQPKPIPWTLGATCLLMQWVLVFNQWPRVGARRFFRESRFLKFEIFLLLLVSGSFALGFALAA